MFITSDQFIKLRLPIAKSSSLLNRRQSVPRSPTPSPVFTPVIVERSIFLPLGAIVFGHDLPALLASDGATPVEFAVATANNLRFPLLRPESALSAQPSATPPLPLGEVLATLEAFPSFRPLQPQRGVTDAIIRRVLQVDEFSVKDGAEHPRDRCAVIRAVPSFHPALF